MNLELWIGDSGFKPSVGRIYRPLSNSLNSVPDHGISKVSDRQQKMSFFVDNPVQYSTVQYSTV